MAASATPRAADLPGDRDGRPSPRIVAVACSGGRDSVALLHATASAAATLGLRVVALHVHHGLSPQADAWLAHLESLVTRWAADGWPVALRHERLTGVPAAGDSVEAWARAGRYRALQRLATDAGADLLLLAHHRRDQAETFLLQALRGAGAAGLASMPRAQWREGVCWARPWLDRPREAIDAYVAQHGLSVVEDDSNSDVRFARNRLRVEVMPALRAVTAGGAETALAQSARWAQEALALQAEMAEVDLAAFSSAGGLDQALFGSLSPVRARNALRAWLQRVAGRPAPASLVERLMQELPPAQSARWPFGTAELRLYRGLLTLGVPSEGGTSPTSSTSAAEPERERGPLDLSRPGLHALPGWGGALDVFLVKHGGVPASRLNNVELRPREGGEAFQHHPGGLPRSLKKCWQSAAIAPPQREGPLLYVDGALLFVPALGIDARHWAGRDEAQYGLRWRPAHAAHPSIAHGAPEGDL